MRKNRWVIFALLMFILLTVSVCFLPIHDLPDDNVYTIDAAQLAEMRGCILGTNEGSYDLEVQYRIQSFEEDGVALTAHAAFTFPVGLAPEEVEISSGYTTYNQKKFTLLQKLLRKSAETQVLEQDSRSLMADYESYSQTGEVGISGVGTFVYPDLYQYPFTYVELPVQVSFMLNDHTYTLETSIRVTFE